jgi:hypothetical protein
VRAKVPTPRHASPATIKLLQLALRKDRLKRIQSAGRFAELIGQTLGAVRAAEEGRPVPELSGALAASAVHTGAFAPVSSSGRPATPTSGAPTTSKLPLVLVTLGVLGLAITIYTLLASNGDGTGAAANTTAGADTKAAAATDAGLPMNRAVIRSNVEAASVVVDGKPHCTTPCEITVPVGDNKVHEIRLTKPGFIDSVQSWRPVSVTDALPPFPNLQPVATTIEIKGSGKKRGG